MTPETSEADESDRSLGCRCEDCFGRDVFAGSDPDAPLAPVALRAPVHRTFRRFLVDHRRTVILLLGAAAATVFVLAVVPQITGVADTLNRLSRADLAWLLFGVALEALSIAAYVALFKTVFSCEGTRIGWKASYEITLAGLVATKLFAAAGAGGIALTVWALRAAGLQGRTIARRIAGFEILLYSLFMLALFLVGLGLGTGLLGARAPLAISLFPAGFGGLVIAVVLSVRLIPARADPGFDSSVARKDVTARAVARLGAIPRGIRDGMTSATEMLHRPAPGLLGAVAYWAFDIAALWTGFRAFGTAPSVAIVVMGYYVGQLANTIPLPGGIGAVEGGLIGAFIALGVNGSTAILGVLAYRAISFWLPTLPGAIAYFQLRRTISRWRAGDPPQSHHAGAVTEQTV